MTLSYNTQADVFLNQARDELQKGDLRQAAEKGWGAAAQMVKAVAQKRQESHHHHAELLGVVSRLVQETRDADLMVQFDAAQALHTAFYEGAVSDFEVGLRLRQVSDFIAKLRLML